MLLLRHGLTEHNERRLFTGAQDIPLSEAGEEALRLRAGRYPSATRFFTSGMLRARQTLAIIYGDVGSTDIPELAEYRFGDFENRGHDDLYANEPLYRQWLDSTAEEFALPGGESRQAFAERVRQGWNRLAAHQWDGLAVLVAHGGVIGAVLRLHQLMEDDHVHTDNGCGWRVSLLPDGRMKTCEAFS